MVTVARAVVRILTATVGALALLATAVTVTAMITFSTGLMATIPGLVHVLPGATEPSADIFAEPLAPLWFLAAALAFAALDRQARRASTIRRRLARTDVGGRA